MTEKKLADEMYEQALQIKTEGVLRLIRDAAEDGLFEIWWKDVKLEPRPRDDIRKRLHKMGFSTGKNVDDNRDIHISW